MESGINADQNFYSRRPLPQSPDQNRQHQQIYDPPPLPDFEARSPQLPPKLPFLTTQNLQAATANANGFGGSGGLNGGADRDPDDFYRQYRGVQSSSNGFIDTATNGMAATASESRPTPSTLRSNGNGSTPKHPPLPTARTTSKPSYRSASSPLDDRANLNNAKSSPALNGYNNARQPSVKDLLKRFDQNRDQPSSTVPKPTPRINTRDANGLSGYLRDRDNRLRTTVNGQTSANSTRAGPSTREAVSGKKPPTNTRTTQRTRFAAEDQQSNNILSSVARPTRLRNGISGTNPHASKSMVNLSPTSPTAPTQTRQPLFGEVLANGQGPPDIGYGIPHTATRRTSDSSLHPTWIHQRSKSNVDDDVDVDPSSPTAWYLGVTPALDDVDPNKPRITPGHNRNHSDFADTKVNTMNGVNPSFQTSNPPKLSAAAQLTSRLPTASKRRNSSSDSSSIPSTRANSPFAQKSRSNGKLRKAEQRPFSPAGRSMTPTNRAKTPTRTSPPRNKAKTPERINTNTASLKAHVIAPLPKTSPPLRGSRSRQPVSSATTSSSRQKAAERSGERSGSPQQVRTGMKITRNSQPRETNDTKHPPRKIPDVPLASVDFADRRAKIQRAYTKSIHESQQKEIRAANLRRLQARQSVASPSAERNEAHGSPEVPPENESRLETTSPPSEPLQITTSFHKSDHDESLHRRPPVDQDSPTLGMPGTFVHDEEPPPSAISCAETEIDNEPQTEPPRFSRMPSNKGLGHHSRLSSQIVFREDHLSPEQALFGIEHDSESIQIMLATTPVEQSQPQLTPTNDMFKKERDPSPPGAFQQDEDYEYERPLFETNITTASPKEATPIHSRATTPLESSDERMSYNDSGQNISEESLAPEELPQSHITPEISFPEEDGYPGAVEASEGPRLDLPYLRTALAPPSLAPSDGQDYLNTPVTDFDYDSSDAGAANTSGRETEDTSFDTHQEDTLAPRIYQPNRQSAWTDYSVETNDDYSPREEFPPIMLSSDPVKKPTPPPKLQPPPIPPKPEAYSPESSPQISTDAPQLSSPNRHQLPPLVTGDGFGLGFDQYPGLSSSVPLWPDYSPPPIPQQPGESSPALSSRSPPPTSFYNRRPPSSLYQPGRNSESRRASDDLYSPRASVSTPRSSTQISFEDTVAELMKPKIPLQTEEDKAAAEAESKRLFKRKMVIKEIIDTESVYLKDLNVVEEIYKGTAEACPKLDSADVKAIFRNTDEIVAFSQMFLDELKSAGSSVYSPRSQRTRQSRATTTTSTATTSISPSAEDRFSVAATLTDETDEQKDRKTFIGANFGKHLQKMQVIYTDFLKNSEQASSRLAALQADPAVKVWLSECNLVAKDLTAAWDLDALLVKPVQRITRYQLLLSELQKATPEEHPDYDALQMSQMELGKLLRNIDDLKKRIHMVGAIVGRKRKESDVRSGLAKAFGRRAEKLQISNANRPQDDEVYLKAHERFQDDYLRLQVVLRDVEFYTRQMTTWVNDFLRYLSAVELYMRMSASPYPEIESKWARFNMSMRDIGTVALEDHIAMVRQKVIEPFEQVIQCYSAPGVAMKKRSKRRLDYERFLVIKSKGKVDEKLSGQVAQYEALNETLKLELPKLASLTMTIGKICGIQFVNIQTQWWAIWQDKVRVVLEDSQVPKDIAEIVEMFSREYKYGEARAHELGIISGNFGQGVERDSGVTRSSQGDGSSLHAKSRPSDLSRTRGLSMTSDKSPSLPTPDFAKRHSGQFTFSPLVANAPGLPQFAYSHQPYSASHSRAGSGSPATPDHTGRPHASSLARPGTSRSYTSDNGMQRMSTDYNHQHRRESGSTYNSASYHVDGPPMSGRPFSGIFHSAMPLPDGPEESQRSSRASSREREASDGFNVLYLAASLFEFNISATKSEAGYPYLTYQAGEIFDVIGEKGELWLAKNQDDPSLTVGWIWSKHFARLATD